MTEPLLEIAEGVVRGAGPAEEIEAFVARSRETEIKVFGGEVASLAVSEVAGVGVRVVSRHRQGFAWAGSLEPDVVAQTVAEARDNAAFGAPDEAFGVATEADGAGVAPELDLWRAELLEVPTTDKVALALELERATLAADGRVRGVETAEYGDTAAETAVATSAGISAQSRRTVCSLVTFALAEADSETQTGYGFSVGRTIDDLDLSTAARDAAERATRLLGARQPASRRLPVVFDPLVTRSLLGLVSAALSGEAVLKGRSMFVGREGEAVAAPSITLVDDPTMPVAFGAAPYDGEGVPTRRNELIVQGRLAAYLHNTYTARRSGGKTTGAAVRGFKSPPGVGARALHLLPGAKAPAEMLASVPEAFYVQSVSGLHSGTDPVSGDFSVGAEGLMVRDGDFAEPVREVTIASTVPRMLLDVTEVGSDLTWLPGAAAGLTLLVGEMTMSGS